jgi:hypothetical protein
MVDDVPILLSVSVVVVVAVLLSASTSMVIRMIINFFYIVKNKVLSSYWLLNSKFRFGEKLSKSCNFWKVVLQFQAIFIEKMLKILRGYF